MNSIESKSCMLKLVCFGLIALCALATKVQSQSMGHMHSPHEEQQKSDASQGPFRLVIPDVEVVNQDGRKLRLYTDLVKGRNVVINFFYTSCTDVCPLSGDTFARLQKLLGERMGKDVFLLSITTDPEVDTPLKLKTWSERFNPKAGWTFVTGDKTAMKSVLMSLTGEGPRRGVHTPIAFLVNDEAGAWKRTYGLDSPAKLLELLDRLSVQTAVMHATGSADVPSARCGANASEVARVAVITGADGTSAIPVGALR